MYDSATIPDDKQLLAQAAAWPELAFLSRLTHENLERLSRSLGVDFATALLYERLCRSPDHAQAIRQLQNVVVPTDDDLPQLDATLVVVPGAFYEDAKTKTGADGQSVRDAAARFGCASHLVPLAAFGRLDENAQLICRWLAHHAVGDKPVVLVSLSKAGAEVKLALDRPEAKQAFAKVAAWINLSGLVCGTPLVAWLCDRPLRSTLIRWLLWHKGHSADAIQQMDRGPCGLLSGQLSIPEHVCCVHVVGFPLQRHLSTRLSRRGYRRLSPFGPNDGVGNLLFDLCQLPGTIYPLWGADHFLRPDGEDVSQVVSQILLHLSQVGVLTKSREVAFADSSI